MHVLARLRELVAALDRRVPRPERAGERQIAKESAALREEAIAQIARQTAVETAASPHQL